MTSKRKADSIQSSKSGHSKKRAVRNGDASTCFRDDLFTKAVLDHHRTEYAKSEPYKHGVIHQLIDDDLLRSVRSEILQQINFTPKETDIYRIHQSGDLANLDGLDDASLQCLPSLLRLRNALYSSTFRNWISQIGNAGPLSGKKTDMAINVYTPGCHLLCHDDVIGSRRLSYILYLTDPDKPWQANWGGALRLYPTHELDSKDGTQVMAPSAQFSLSISPSWNQMTFFTIQPGLSFHDVEEVYHRKPNEGDEVTDGGRVRMAISGWFHIPQQGEEGYDEGLEESLAAKSSLSQLQESKADQYDLPQPQWQDFQSAKSLKESEDWTASELDFLIKFINPGYLVPDMIEELSESFRDNSVVTLTDFLHSKFADKLKEYILQLDEKRPAVIPTAALSSPMDVGTARPPHKARYLYRHAARQQLPPDSADTPLDCLLQQLLPSELFIRWLRLLVNIDIYRGSVLARRFRRGLDYTLATGYDAPDPQLEISLGLTPSTGWVGAADDEQSEGGPPKEEQAPTSPEEEQVGGYEVYMCGDDDKDDEDEQDTGGDKPSGTGAGNRANQKADPAVYTASSNADDNVLFSMPASWNTLSIVLRDSGLLKFVKYVSVSAKGDRWDISGTYSVRPEDDSDDDDGDDDDDDNKE